MSYNPLLQDLIEVFESKTSFKLNGETLHFRHFSLKDQSEISRLNEKYKIIALKKGLELEKDIYERLKKDNAWTCDDDLKISQLEEYISNLKKSKEKLLLPSQKESHEELIKNASIDLNILLQKKSDLIGITVESYAHKMSNEEFLRLLIYSDESLQKLKYSEKEFGDIDFSSLNTISENYFKMCHKFSDKNIQNIVLQDFFSMYISLCENQFYFFGKPIVSLSTYQVKTMLYARMFHNIFQYNEEMPEDIKKNPDEIFEYLDVKKNRQQFKSRTKDSAGTIVFGATKKDLEILDPEAKKITLSEEVRKSGGVLDMEQMMKIMNQNR